MLPATAAPLVPAAVPTPVASNPHETRCRCDRDHFEAHYRRSDRDDLRGGRTFARDHCAEERACCDGPQRQTMDKSVTEERVGPHG
jgi:hypothetical protein